ncbi:hypothetical protein Dimus_029341 [Dionaea muscipula]
MDLIARAIEKGIVVIKPTGFIIFNLGGRPGQAVCRHLIEHRGFHASDADISALVEIEKNSPHHFEFFTGLMDDLPICARIAWAYRKAGNCIAHALFVKTNFEFLNNGYKVINNSLDLSFEDVVAAASIAYCCLLQLLVAGNSLLARWKQGRKPMKCWKQ